MVSSTNFLTFPKLSFEFYIIVLNLKSNSSTFINYIVTTSKNIPVSSLSFTFSYFGILTLSPFYECRLSIIFDFFSVFFQKFSTASLYLLYYEAGEGLFEYHYDMLYYIFYAFNDSWIYFYFFRNSNITSLMVLSILSTLHLTWRDTTATKWSLIPRDLHICLKLWLINSIPLSVSSHKGCLM